MSAWYLCSGRRYEDANGERLLQADDWLCQLVQDADTTAAAAADDDDDDVQTDADSESTSSSQIEFEVVYLHLHQWGCF